jgi:uncharacterized phage-associated protein
MGTYLSQLVSYCFSGRLLAGKALSSRRKEEIMTVSAHDVAKYISQKCGTMTAMKLQKLLYYCQAWSLVWDETPLFSEKIEAWANGPVVAALYPYHRGHFEVESWTRGDTQKLSPEQINTVDSVLKYYGDQTAQWLSELSHQEAPWKDAREGIAAGERGDKEITHAAMAEYYGSL